MRINPRLGPYTVHRFIQSGTCTAPAGSAAAAALEGGALAGPSASPHLLVVGAGNPVAVLGLAR
jgi:hypothetical protein